MYMSQITDFLADNLPLLTPAEQLEIKKLVGDLTSHIPQPLDKPSPFSIPARSPNPKAFPIGRTVKFIAGRPKYLIGMEATVTGHTPTKVKIKFNDPEQARRFGSDQQVNCPASLLQLI
jgi:hypothetical protein